MTRVLRKIGSMPPSACVAWLGVGSGLGAIIYTTGNYLNILCKIT